MNVEHLKKYKDSCYSALSRDLTEFEKNFLLISGGILAFSITFIKDIVKVDQAHYLVVLFISWGIIIISIGLMMHTFLKSATYSDQLWKIVDDFIEENNLYDDKKDLSDDQCKAIKGKINEILYPSKGSLKKQRLYAVNSFLLGIVFFSLFVSLNIFKEKKAIDNSKTVSVKKVFLNDTLIISN